MAAVTDATTAVPAAIVAGQLRLTGVCELRDPPLARSAGVGYSNLPVTLALRVGGMHDGVWTLRLVRVKFS